MDHKLGIALCRQRYGDPTWTATVSWGGADDKKSALRARNHLKLALDLLNAIKHRAHRRLYFHGLTFGALEKRPAYR